MIKHEGDKWILYSKDGDKVLGTHDSKEDAEKQERAIEANRHAESRQLHLLGATGEIRTESIDGRDYYVVPVVALMEGVIHAVNAETPEFVPFETLQQAASSWNGKPVCLNHPVKDGKQCSANAPEILESYGIGFIRNSHVDDKKRLLQEALIDKEKIEKRHTKMAALLAAGKQIEVSVGAFVQTLKEAGQHLGKRFMARWQETGGDHLAFLPDGRGACSIEMGCGAHRAATMRVCEDHFELITAAPLPEGSEVKPDALGNREDYSGSKGTGYVQSYGENKFLGCYTPTDGEKVEREFSSKEAATVFVQEAIDAITDIKVIGAAGKRNSAADMKVIQDMHDRSVDLGAECVAKNVRFMEVSTIDGSEEEIINTVMNYLPKVLTEAEEDSQTFREKFAALIYGKKKKKECPLCKGTGSKDGNPCEGCDGNGYLKAAAEGQTQEEIDRILDEKAAKGAAEFKAACGCGGGRMEKTQRDEIIKMLVEDSYSGFTAGDEKFLEGASDDRLESFKVAAEARAKTDKDLRAAASQPLTKEKFMEIAPPEIKSLVKRQERQETEMKAQLIATLKTAQSEFSEAELSLKDNEELTRMVKMLNVEHKVDYRGKGVPRAAAVNEEEDFTPPNPYEKDLKALQSRTH